MNIEKLSKITKESFNTLSIKINKTFPELKYEVFESDDNTAFSISFLVPVNDEDFTIEIELFDTENLIKARFGLYDEDARTTALMKEILETKYFKINNSKSIDKQLSELSKFIINKADYIITKISDLIKLSKIQIPKNLITAIIISLKTIEKRIIKRFKNSSFTLDEFDSIKYKYFRLAIESEEFGEIIIHVSILKRIKDFECEILLDFIETSSNIKTILTNKNSDNIKLSKINTVFNRCSRIIWRELKKV